MHTADTTPQILDFNNFRQQRLQEQPAAPEPYHIPEGFTPQLMWYPVWVLVPNPKPTTIP